MGDDPCTRKPTNPNPVLAPLKRQTELSETNEMKKLKTILEHDLDLSDCETSKIPGKEDEQSTINTANEVDTSVRMLLNIMVEEVVNNENPKPTKDVLVRKMKNSMGEKSFGEIDKPVDEPSRKVLSKEYISSSEDEDLVKTVSKISANQKSKSAKSEKKPILIPIQKRNQCKYIFVKKPRKGERCNNLTNSDFCIHHSKTYNKKENPTPSGYNENFRHLQIATQEMSSKIDHILSKEKDEKNTYDSLQKKIVQLENKIESFNKVKKSERREPKKMHKLNKQLSYNFVGFDEHQNLKLQSEAKTFLVKRPKSFLVPKHIRNCKLKYNFEKRRFEFTA